MTIEDLAEAQESSGSYASSMAGSILALVAPSAPVRKLMAEMEAGGMFRRMSSPR